MLLDARSFEGYDFVDFGCSSGGSIDFGLRKFKGTRGLGLDMDPGKVAAVRAKGFDARICDVMQIPALERALVRFSLLIHFTEHLNSVADAAKCIQSAVALSSEFVFIRQPFFDADPYLSGIGLKVYWSDWSGHRNRMRSYDLFQICDRLLFDKKIHRFVLFCRSPILNSDDPAILPINTPKNQHQWDPAKHGPKPSTTFSMAIYREIGAVLFTDAAKSQSDVLSVLKDCTVLYDSITSPFAN